MENIRVLAISPTGRLWARLPNKKKKRGTLAYTNTRSPRLSDLSLFQAWGDQKEKKNYYHKRGHYFSKKMKFWSIQVISFANIESSQILKFD